MPMIEGKLRDNQFVAIPITCRPVRSCHRCGAERFQTRIVNGYADAPGEPRYLSICMSGHGCRHSDGRLAAMVRGESWQCKCKGECPYTK